MATKAFDTLEFIFVCVLGATIPLSVSAPLIAMAFLLILMILRAIFLRDVDFEVLPFLWPLLAFIGVSVISYFFSQNESSWQTIIPREFLVYLLLFAALKTYKQARWVVVLTITSAVVASIVGVFQYFGAFGFSNVSADGRIQGLVDTNTLAGILAMLLPMVISFAISAHSTRDRVIVIIAACFMSTALVFTYTRGAWFGAVAGILLVVALSNWKFIPAILAVVFLVLAVQPKVYNRFVSGFGILGNEERVELYKNSVDLLRQYPVFGIGPGAFRKVFYEKYFSPNKHRHAHNIFLNIAVERGVVAAGIFVWLLVSIALYLFRTYEFAAGEEKTVLLGILSGLADFVVHGMVDNTFADETGYILFLLLAVAVLINKKMVEREENS
ncbi:MAG: O-antigen ligase family protein [Elusimicrobiota bacterium]